MVRRRLIKAQQLSPELAIAAGVIGAGGIGLVVGLVAIRRQGIYFAMITMAIAQMVYFVCLQAPFTGGEDGLQGVSRGNLFGVFPLATDTAMYYVVVTVFVACFLLISRILHSPFGQVLKMIRENEPRAISLGYEVDRYKLLAFVLSSALAGLAGSLKTLVMGFATLSDVHWTMSGEVIPDDAARWRWHFLRPGVWCGHCDLAARHVGRQGRLVGQRHHRRHFCTVRAGIPKRGRGRDSGLFGRPQARSIRYASLNFTTARKKAHWFAVRFFSGAATCAAANSGP